MDGGRNAARGYQYQYHRTLEWLLELLDDPAVEGVRVEGPEPDPSHRDSVDFDVVRADGTVLLAAQAKSRALGLPMTGPKAFEALAAMAQRAEADRYVLLTNANLDENGQTLAAILRQHPSHVDLRLQLAELFTRTNAPARLAQLAGLDDVELTRLGRSTIQVDHRDDEIRADLREAIRTYRNRARAGLGEASEGLLSGYLISQVLRRAADTSGASALFTAARLREHLLVSQETLAQALGRRDWGIAIGFVPRVPDVPRPALLMDLTGILDTPGVNQVRRVAMLGASGIGKSSLASLYIAARADAYDAIGWIDCDTPTTIEASFRALASHLEPGTPADGQRPEFVHRVRAALAGLPGRWLLVCDNAASPRELEQWIPATGRGDLIITSLDAAANHGDAHLITVETMERGEATTLLARRLWLTAEEQLTHRDALDRMACELGDWPLALELGAGYLRSCGMSLLEVDRYLQLLSLRSIADRDSIPPGYPRTLLAAIEMCLDLLAARSTRELDQANIALAMLYTASFLASHRIPGHLLLSAAASEIADPDKQIPGFLDPAQAPPLGEFLRELRRFSLISTDIPLPREFPDFGPESVRTIAVNTVVQLVLRARATADPSIHTGLDDLAWHVNAWLRRSLGLSDAEGALVLQAHAERLLEHVEALGLSSLWIALLYGNLAGLYIARREPETAMRLYEHAARHVLNNPPINHALRIQNLLGIATGASEALEDSTSQERTNRLSDLLVTHLEHVYFQSQSWAQEEPAAALKLVILAQNLLQRPPVQALESTPLAQLATAFSQLRNVLPDSEYSTHVDLLEKTELLLQRQDYAGAERNARQLIETGVADVEAQARRLLIEALIGLENWPEAVREVNDWAHGPDGPRLQVGEVVDLLHNAGFAAATRVLLGHPEPAEVLDTLLAWPDITEVLRVAIPGERNRIALLAVIRDKAHGRPIEQRRRDELAHADLSSPYGKDEGWRLLRQLVLPTPVIFTDAD